MAIARPAACPVTAQAGITRVISHIASVTLMILPAAMQLTRSSVYSVRSGIS